MNFVDQLRQFSGIPEEAPLAPDTSVPVCLVGWYAPRAVIWDESEWLHSPALVQYAEACFLAVDLADNGLMFGYLRVAHDQGTAQASEAGEIHYAHFDLSRVVLLEDVTFDDATGTNDMPDHEFRAWLDRHTRR